MKFRITSFHVIDPSPCVLFFPMYFLFPSIDTKKLKQTLKFCNGIPTSITDVAKIAKTYNMDETDRVVFKRSIFMHSHNKYN